MPQFQYIPGHNNDYYERLRPRPRWLGVIHPKTGRIAKTQHLVRKASFRFLCGRRFKETDKLDFPITHQRRHCKICEARLAEIRWDWRHYYVETQTREKP